MKTCSLDIALYQSRNKEVSLPLNLPHAYICSGCILYISYFPLSCLYLESLWFDFTGIRILEMCNEKTVGTSKTTEVGS